MRSTAPARYEFFRKAQLPALASAVALFALFSLSIPLPASGQGQRQTDWRNAFTSVAQQATPAVVHLEVTEKKSVPNPFLPFEKNPFFRDFFGTPKMPKRFKGEVRGLGSGMIIDEKGHILTNNHVAGGATKIEVQLSNGNRYPAKLVGADAKTDLAVIKIEAKERLPYVSFGNSDEVEVGQWVIAIGAPRGLDKTVTQGIISAKHRRGITDPSTYEDFLQTDAAINPGNSGGPLLNLDGKVIGVNTAIATASGGFEGIGFSIPSNMAVHVARALITEGKVTRGWLGITIRDLTQEIARKMNLATSSGVLVMDVIKGGPADKAGLRKDDIIVAYQGKEVVDSAGFRNRVADTPAGTNVTLTVLRNGKRQNLKAAIVNQEESIKYLAGNIKEKLGAEVRLVTPKEAQKYGLDPNTGVAVTWLDFKGPLRKAGFEVNDVILGIDGAPITSIEEFEQTVSQLQPGSKIAVSVLDHRTGNQGIVAVEIK